MNKEITFYDFEDFIIKLYKAIEEASKENIGIQLALSPNECKKIANEGVKWIEIY